MKYVSTFLILSSMAFLVGCQEKSSNKSSSAPNNCVQYPYASGCNGYTTGGSSSNTYCTQYPYASGCNGYTGGAAGGTTGTTNNCTVNWYAYGCPGYTGGSAGGSTGTNPFPYYGSAYVDKNWLVKYPYVPSISCSTPVDPTGVSYTPYETRKGTVTVIGAGFGPIPGTNQYRNPQDPKAWYDPNTYVTISGDQTSERLRTLEGAKEFFWTDSTLKIRFKANLQPDSNQANPICAGRVPAMSVSKGYTKIKFDLYLVGTDINNRSTEEFLGEQTIEINKCTTPLNLASYRGTNYPAKYPNGIYLKIKNVKGNQNWAPGTYAEQQAYDLWGFYPRDAAGQGNPYYNGDLYMPAIRANDCWSVDIEVAADGTKTF